MPDSYLDSLKPLAEVTTADPRMENLSVGAHDSDGPTRMSLEQYYAFVADENLPGHLPVDIRQKYETARNLLIYSWYCYRFFPVATLELYSTLELALRHVLGTQGGRGRPGLKALLSLARERGVLKAAGFRDRSPSVLAPPIARDAPEEAFMDAVTQVVPYLRNALAHGGALLWPDFQTLRFVHDALVQLFPDEASDIASP